MTPKRRRKVALTNVDKVDKQKDDIVAKRRPFVLIINCVDYLKLILKDSKRLPFIFVYSLIQKREKVAHCLSVFYIEIFDFDSFDMILKIPCKNIVSIFWKDCFN